MLETLMIIALVVFVAVLILCISFFFFKKKVFCLISTIIYGFMLFHTLLNRVFTSPTNYNTLKKDTSPIVYCFYIPVGLRKDKRVYLFRGIEEVHMRFLNEELYQRLNT